MRRKDWGRLNKFLGPGVMSALQVWLWLLIFVFQNSIPDIDAAEPGYLDFDNLPETNFSCAGKVIGGYYADLETDCQMFHVCTIGQLEEPMDIKFLCLNGTVFDQETRVCERVDEVDCSKSEHFYSLNLELYGNTAPPIIKPETVTKKAEREPEEDEEEEIDEEYDYEEPPSTTKATTTTTTTTTRKPTTRIITTHKPTYYHTTVQTYHYDPSSDADIDAYDLIDDNEDKEPSTHSNKNNTKDYQDTNYNYDSDPPPHNPSNSDGHKHQFDEYDLLGEHESEKTTDVDNNSQNFNPQDFIYRHNNPHELVHKNSPAVSFQQQSFSSDGKNSHVTVTTHVGKEQYGADITKVNKANKNVQLSRTYLTSSTPHSNTNSQNDKSHNYNNNYPGFETPNRTPLIPTLTVKNQPPTGHPGLTKPKQNEPLYLSFRKPPLTPQGFKPNPINANIRLNPKPVIKTQAKPFQSYQPSERHEISINSEFDIEKLSPTYPQDYSQYHYEHKRSQDNNKYEPQEDQKKTDSVSITSAPYFNIWTTRGTNETKSLPRVIVTASASVSDSNGKKLNYTVGNILHAVKPVVTTNYDEYKEDDVPLDPFFFDVPKLKKNRSKRSVKKKKGEKLQKRAKRSQVFLLDANDYKMKELETTTMKISTKVDLPLYKKPTLLPEINEQKNNQNSHKSQSIPFTHKPFTYPNVPTTTTHWIPPDYVDDNYEPQTYEDISKKKVGDEITTIGNVAKTTLDISRIETTTSSFVAAIANINSHKKGPQNYKLHSVHTVNFSDEISDNFSNSVNFSCIGKKYYKFYPDKTNCRTFHMCSPGLGTGQVLDIIFNCDSGSYYNSNIMKCVSDKPNDCESVVVLI